MMKKRIINKSIFIGLGGTGQNIIKSLKKQMIDNFGEVPSPVRLLSIDTDVQDVNKGDVELVGNEFIHIPATSTTQVIGYSHITEWLDTSLNIIDSDSGAAQKRYQGRFSFFNNANDLLGIPDKLIEDLNVESQLTGLDKYEVVNKDKTKTCIHLIFSPCGGTGSGTFLDIANIIKYSIPDDCILYAHMISPEYYIDFSPNHSMYANTYGAMKEIDYLMDKYEETLDGIYHNPWKPSYMMNSDYSYQFPVNWSFEKPQVNYKLFDQIIFWDKTNEIGMHKEIDDLVDSMSAMLYQVINAPGLAIESAFNNSVELRSNEQTGNKLLNYMAIGYGELVINKQDVKDLIKVKSTSVILNKYLSPSSIDSSNDVLESLIDRVALREDKSLNRNDVRSDLYDNTKVRFDREGIIAGLNFDDGLPDSIKAEGEQVLKSIISKCENELITNVSAVTVDRTKKIKDLIKEKLVQYGGLSFSQIFLKHLNDYCNAQINALSQELNISKRAFEESKTKLGSSYNHLLDIEDAIWPFGKEDKLKDESSYFLDQVKVQIDQSVNIEIVEGCIAVFKGILIELAKEGQLLQNYSQVMNDAKANLATNILRITNLDKKNTENVISLYNHIKQFITVGEADLDLVSFQAKEMQDFMSVKSLNDIESLVNQFLERTLNTEADSENEYVSKVVEYYRMDAEAWLSYLLKENKNMFDDVVSQLRNCSAVNCRFSKSGLLGSEVDGLSNVQNIFISNKEKSELSILDSQAWKSVFKSTEEWKRETNLMDDSKIGCLQIKGNFAANAISDLAAWKNKYKGRNFEYSNQYHIDKRFVNAPDLFPEPFAKSAIIYFGLGHALGKIKLDGGSGYKINVGGDWKNLFTVSGKDKTDRYTAFSYFKEIVDFIKEIKAFYESEKRENPQGIKIKLFEHFNKLNIDLSPSHPDYQFKRQIFGKKIESMDAEEKQIIVQERREVANFCLNNGVMVEADYQFEVVDGQKKEKYTHEDLRQLGII
jgi:hypothetical protein